MTQPHSDPGTGDVQYASIETADDRRRALVNLINTNTHPHDARTVALACAARTVVTNLLADILSSNESGTNMDALKYYTGVAESLIADWSLNVRLVRWAGEACAMLEEFDTDGTIPPDVFAALSDNVHGGVTSTDHSE